MSRRIWFVVCAAAGVLLVAGGLLIPAHLRAVEGAVLEIAGKKSAALIPEGVQTTSPGIARLLLEAAQKENVPDRDRLVARVATLTTQEPAMPRISPAAKQLQPGPEPFTEFAVQIEHREQLLELLSASARPEVQALLRFRARTNLVLFPPSSSAGGQAFDTSIAIAGALLEDGRTTSTLGGEVNQLAIEAARGGDSGRLETALLDFMSLGQRFNYGQLQAFVGGIRDVATLDRMTELVRRSDDRLPVLFAAVHLSGDPAGVADYLMHFSKTGLADLGASLRYGHGGVDELLRRDQRLHQSRLGPPLAGEYALLRPRVALMVKWLLYLAGGFLLAAAMHFARAVPRLERPLQVRGFHVAREFLFALGFLAVVLLVSEPFLAEESQKVQMPFRLRLPMVGDAVRPGTLAASPASFMNQSLLTLLLFFVLQALIYTACVVKLAEIRRQNIPARVKLRLLENEEHLFDAGLYLGFCGTIISLILVSLGVVKPSLMAAYSSTSFGIIFVSAFKIFNLRPVRRRLLLEAESMPPVPSAPVPPSVETRTQAS